MIKRLGKTSLFYDIIVIGCDDMNDISLIIESLTPEQYKKLYKDLPIPTITISRNKDEYMAALTNNVYQKKLLNVMLNNNFNISHVTDNSIDFLLDINNGKVIKYLREHLNSTGIEIDTKGLPNGILNCEVKYNSERDLQVLNQILENYYLVNQSTFNEKANDYIMRLYQESPEEYLNYIKEINKNEIEILKEEHLQESRLPFNNSSGIQVTNENEVSIRDIYNNDMVFNKIPFEKLTQEQKQIMCNKYFREVLKEKIKIFNANLNKMFGVKYSVSYSNQFEQNLGNYGITGNTPPFDENKIYEIMINMYPNVDYCSFNGDKAILNTDLLGQIMITLLHEHEHILQRIGMVDENIKNAITNFNSIYPDGSDGYFENYANDPAEIDANLVSFNRFVELSKFYNIDNPDVIIMKKINNVIKKAKGQINLYDNNSFSNYAEIQEYLYQKLQNSMITYNNIENIGKSY